MYANWNQVILVTKILHVMNVPHPLVGIPGPCHPDVCITVLCLCLCLQFCFLSRKHWRLDSKLFLLWWSASNTFGPIWYLFLWSICFYLQLLSKKEKYYVRMYSDSATRNIITLSVIREAMMLQSKQNDWPMWKHYLSLY